MRLPIRTKLIGSFGLLFVLSLIIGVLSINRLGATDDHVTLLGRHVVPATATMGEITTTTNKIRKDQMHYVLSAAADRPGVRDDLTGDSDDLDKLFATFKPGSFDAPYAARLRKAIAGYVSAATPYRAMADRGELVAAGEFLSSGPPDKAWDGVKSAMAAWQKAAIDNAANVADEAESQAAAARTAVIVVLLIALAAAAALAILISRGIGRGVSVALDRLSMLREHCTTDLRGALEAMSRGDLTVEVTPVTPHIERFSNDEIGDLGQAVNAVRDNTVGSVEAYNAARASLTEMVGQVSHTASTLGSASQQMAQSSDETGRAIGEIAGAVGEVAQGAERQVHAVESARGVTESMTAATADGTRQAQETVAAAGRARSVADEGAGAVQEATEAMAAVRESSARATDAIRELGSKSEQIGGIVDTITSIAEQTNLLALNAAIEAARAGEQGKGFAVVADEVRKLAEESQQAAATIAGLIAEIQAETTKAVEVVEDGARRTDGGAATVEQARSSFVTIGESVADMTERVEAIAGAIDRIAADAQRVQRDIGEVASVAEQSSSASEEVSASTQQTSASTQEVAAAAQELARTAQELEELVGRFTLAA
jgi:methyl-accepting chemotaxis protein